MSDVEAQMVKAGHRAFRIKKAQLIKFNAKCDVSGAVRFSQVKKHEKCDAWKCDDDLEQKLAPRSSD
jgi:hypothetical protein